MGGQDVRIGILGAGRWAVGVHVPNLLRARGACLHAVCTRSAANAARVREAAGREVPVYDDYDRFLAESGCEAIIVSTPNWLHDRHAARALDAGMHVLCEKPISLTRDGCEQLGEAVRRSGRVFQIGFELRYSGVARAVRGLVERGRLGRVMLLTVRVVRDWRPPAGWRSQRPRSGGLFAELVCHYTDLASYLLGEGAVRASLAGRRGGDGAFAEYAATVLSYPSGAAASINVCTATAQAGREVPLAVFGDAGRAEAEIISGRVRLLPRGGDDSREDHTPARPAGEVHGFPGSLESIESFAECVRTGAAPLADYAAGRAAVLTTLACQSALDAGHEAVAIEA